MASTKKNPVETKTRTWSFIGYVESLPSDYEKILTEDLAIKWARSPLHDLDTDDNGELKKPHYHFILSFEGPKSYNRVKAITVEKLNSTIPKPVESVRGLVRYFVHLDNPDKAPYSRSDIVSALGFDIITPFQDAITDRNDLIELLQFIDQSGIRDIGDLVHYVLECGKPEWLDIISSRCTFFINLYLKRNRR